MIVDSPAFLNKTMIFFLILYCTGSLLPQIEASSSYLHILTFSVPIKPNNGDNHQVSKHTNSTWKQIKNKYILTNNCVTSNIDTEVSKISKVKFIQYYPIYFMP